MYYSFNKATVTVNPSSPRWISKGCFKLPTFSNNSLLQFKFSFPKIAPSYKLIIYLFSLSKYKTLHLPYIDQLLFKT